VNAVKKLRNKTAPPQPDAFKAPPRSDLENRSPVNALRAAADSLSAMQKWYLNDVPEDDYAIKAPPRVTYDEPVVITLPKSPVKRIPKSELQVVKPNRSLTPHVSDLVTISSTPQRLTICRSPVSVIQSVKCAELQELQAANQDMVGMLGKQELANEKLRTELREARAELTKWRRAFSTLPADRFDRYSQRLHENVGINTHW
jgi:hypothetical protein